MPRLFIFLLSGLLDNDSQLKKIKKLNGPEGHAMLGLVLIVLERLRRVISALKNHGNRAYEPNV